MRSTRQIVDYAGPSRLLKPERGLKLDPRRHGWMPKVDGAYATVGTDRLGAIVNVLGRDGRDLSAWCRHLIGRRVGLPDARLHGELEAHTEAGARAAADRGEAWIHIFDVSRLAGRSVTALPFAERYASLHRWQAGEECGIDGSWRYDASRRAHDAEGKFTRTAAANLKALPIVPLVRTRAGAEDLWTSYVTRGGGEGLVAVRLDAPLTSRPAKIKIRPVDTLDAVVVRHDRAGAVLDYRGHQFVVACSGAVNSQLAVGLLVEVVHNGWYESSVTPRFARIVRVRRDLIPAVLH